MAVSSCQQTVSGCPPLVTYPRDVQTRAADELDRLPRGAAVKVLVTDYGKLRDACRVVGKR